MSRTPLLAALTALAAACGADRASPPLLSLTELESPAAPGSGEPNLALGPNGEVYLSWLEPTDSSTHALRFATLGAEGWSAPMTISEGANFFVNWADFPSLAALPDGSLAAHWLVRSGRRSEYDIHLARSFDGGATWSAAPTPHRDGTVSEHGFVSLFPEPDGALSAVWLDGRKYAEAGAGEHDPEGEMMLRATTLSAEGVLGEEIALDERTCDCCQTAAALTAEGPVVAYRDRSPEEVRDIALVRRVGGRWSEPVTVHEDGWVISACPVNGPAIAAEGRTVALAWFTAARDTARVLLAFSTDAGATFTAPVEVSDGEPAGRVGVALLPGGSALVSWLERVDGAAEVRVRRVDADGKVGPSLAVATSSGERASGFPRLIRSGGDVVLAWTEPTRPARVRTARATIPRS